MKIITAKNKLQNNNIILNKVDSTNKSFDNYFFVSENCKSVLLVCNLTQRVVQMRTFVYLNDRKGKFYPKNLKQLAAIHSNYA